MYKHELIQLLKENDSKKSLFSSEDVRITMLKAFLASNKIKTLDNNAVINLDDFYNYLRVNWRKKNSNDTLNIDELFNDTFLNSDDASAILFRFFIEDNNRSHNVSKRYYPDVNNYVAKLNEGKASAAKTIMGDVYFRSISDSASERLQWEIKQNITRIGDGPYINLLAFLHKKNLLDNPALFVYEHISGSIYGDEHVLAWDYFFKTLDRFGKLNFATVNKLLASLRTDSYMQLKYASIFDDLRQSSTLSATNIDLLTNASSHNIHILKQVIRKLSQRGILTDESYSQIIKLSEKIYSNLDHMYADQYMLELANIPIHLLTPTTLTHFINICATTDCKNGDDLNNFREKTKKTIERLQKGYNAGMAIGILGHTPLPRDVAKMIGSFFPKETSTKAAAINKRTKASITSELNTESMKLNNDHLKPSKK